MSKLSIVDERDVAPDETMPFGMRADSVLSSRTLSPEAYSLRLTAVELDAEGQIEWGHDHGEEGIYVLEGDLHVDGRTCDTGSAATIESGVAVTMTANTRTRFVHCSRSNDGPVPDGPYGPPLAENHTCHVVGPGGWYRSEHDTGVVATWFADATCPTCRIMLFRVDHDHGYAGLPHSHSQDEIIYVLDGSVKLGKHEYFAGTALCIPADVRYRVAYPNGGGFLNYRADVSEHQLPGGVPAKLEGGRVAGGALIADFR